MPISSEHVKFLESYRDKAYITSILCVQSSEHFEFLRSIINIPLILSSSVMTVMNKMNESNRYEININNIVINTWTSLILSLVGNFKLTEHATNFNQICRRMMTYADVCFVGVSLGQGAAMLGIERGTLEHGTH
jgi:hypothetical protein